MPFISKEIDGKLLIEIDNIIRKFMEEDWHIKDFVEHYPMLYKIYEELKRMERRDKARIHIEHYQGKSRQIGLGR